MTLVSRNDGMAVTTKATATKPKGCVSGVRSPFSPRGKVERKVAMRLAEIYRQAKNCAQLDDDGVHLPVAVRQADVQQRFREPQVRGGTDRQKFRQAFYNSQDQRQQVVVQSASRSKGTVSQKNFAGRLAECGRSVSDRRATISITRISVSGNALLDVEDQPLGAMRPNRFGRIG